MPRQKEKVDPSDKQYDNAEESIIENSKASLKKELHKDKKIISKHFPLFIIFVLLIFAAFLSVLAIKQNSGNKDVEQINPPLDGYNKVYPTDEPLAQYDWANKTDNAGLKIILIEDQSEVVVRDFSTSEEINSFLLPEECIDAEDMIIKTNNDEPEELYIIYCDKTAFGFNESGFISDYKWDNVNTVLVNSETTEFASLKYQDDWNLYLEMNSSLEDNPSFYKHVTTSDFGIELVDESAVSKLLESIKQQFIALADSQVYGPIPVYFTSDSKSVATVSYRYPIGNSLQKINLETDEVTQLLGPENEEYYYNENHVDNYGNIYLFEEAKDENSKQKISVLNLNTGNVEKEITVPKKVHYGGFEDVVGSTPIIDVSSDGNFVYLTSYFSNFECVNNPNSDPFEYSADCDVNINKLLVLNTKTEEIHELSIGENDPGDLQYSLWLDYYNFPYNGENVIYYTWKRDIDYRDIDTDIVTIYKFDFSENNAVLIGHLEENQVLVDIVE